MMIDNYKNFVEKRIAIRKEMNGEIVRLFTEEFLTAKEISARIDVSYYFVIRGLKSAGLHTKEIKNKYQALRMHKELLELKDEEDPIKKWCEKNKYGSRDYVLKLFKSFKSLKIKGLDFEQFKKSKIRKRRIGVITKDEAVRLYFVEGKTLDEIGQMVGLTRQRIQQIIASFEKEHPREVNKHISAGRREKISLQKAIELYDDLIEIKKYSEDPIAEYSRNHVIKIASVKFRISRAKKMLPDKDFDQFYTYVYKNNIAEWAKKRKEIVASLYEQGLSLKEIAEKTETSTGAIGQLLIRMREDPEFCNRVVRRYNVEGSIRVPLSK